MIPVQRHGFTWRTCFIQAIFPPWWSLIVSANVLKYCFIVLLFLPTSWTNTCGYFGAHLSSPWIAQYEKSNKQSISCVCGTYNCLMRTLCCAINCKTPLSLWLIQSTVPCFLCPRLFAIDDQEHPARVQHQQQQRPGQPRDGHHHDHSHWSAKVIHGVRGRGVSGGVPWGNWLPLAGWNSLLCHQ